MSRGLRSEGYAVDVVADGDAALIQAGVWDYDAIVLDVMLPERDGLEVCRVLRDRRCWAPVLILTARGDASDRIRGLDVGADDYLAKPFDFGELLARLRALTRRTPAERPARLEVGDLMVDPATHEVERLGTGVELTAREFAVFEFLARHAGQVVSRTMLLQRSVRRVVVLLLLAGPAALLATAIGGWLLARRSLRPVEEMASTAAAIGVDRLEDRVPEPRTRDELAHLAHTLNTMLDRIERGVDEQRRLVADASHELRTPLAAMRSEIDVSLRTDDHPAAARQVLMSTREEVDRMSRTVNDLVTLATVDEGLVLSLEPLDLDALTESVIESVRAVADAREVTVDHQRVAVPVLADPERLRHAIRNVVENAIKFSPAGGKVTVYTTRRGSTGRVAVEDEGPGIPAEHRQRVFDRFHRVDAAHPHHGRKRTRARDHPGPRRRARWCCLGRRRRSRRNGRHRGPRDRFRAGWPRARRRRLGDPVSGRRRAFRVHRKNTRRSTEPKGQRFDSSRARYRKPRSERGFRLLKARPTSGLVPNSGPGQSGDVRGLLIRLHPALRQRVEPFRSPTRIGAPSLNGRREQAAVKTFGR